MLGPHKIAPPPRGVKHGIPRRGNDTHRKTSDFYRGVIAVLTTRCWVVICKNGIQWILQKRTKESFHEGIWRGQSYCTSREALLEAYARRELLSDPQAAAVLEALTERARDHRKN